MPRKRLDTLERLERHLVPEPNTGCLLWTGTTCRGYGRTMYPNKERTVGLAHRLMYILKKGPIPDGAVVRHLCDTPTCCNPDHLALGDQKDNALDMLRAGRNRNQNTGRTHCKNGHEFSPENTRVSYKKGKYKMIALRRCHTCVLAAQRRRRRAAAAMKPAA